MHSRLQRRLLRAGGSAGDAAHAGPAAPAKPPRPPADRTRVLPPASNDLGPSGMAWLRTLHAVDCSVAILLWTLCSMPVQGLFLLLPSRAKRRFPLLYWRVFGLLIGMRVRMIGTPANLTSHGRPVVFASNHSSWLDVPVIGGHIETCFVSKDAVQDWPGINLVAKLGRTVYVSRQRASTGRESDVIRQRLDVGDNIVLFPEGTTADGARVLPFRSSFLSVAEGDNPPLVQPVSIVYDRLDGLPVGRWNRPLFAYYGDMNIGIHFWKLAQRSGFRATLLLHPPLDPRDFADRKALTRALQDAVANGAATLRQNRPVGAPSMAKP